MDNRTCCFFGHRKIEDTAELRAKIYDTVEQEILERNIDTFLFGSKSEFDSLCHKTVTDLKEKYPHIKRIYVRAEYRFINEDYKNYLLQSYEDTYYPEKIFGAGRAAYVERNCYMIDKSSVCIIYYNPNYAPPIRRFSHQVEINNRPKSGTKIAYDYAKRKGKIIVNLEN